MNWEAVDSSRLVESIRDHGPGREAERTVWAFEHALQVARSDPELLEHLLVAFICLVAYEEGKTPRAVLEHRFRRSIGDAEWRERFETLLE